MSSLVDVDDPDVIAAENQRLLTERLRRASPPHLSARAVAQTIEQSGDLGGVPTFKTHQQEVNQGSSADRLPPVTVSNLNPKFIPVK